MRSRNGRAAHVKMVLGPSPPHPQGLRQRGTNTHVRWGNGPRTPRRRGPDAAWLSLHPAARGGELVNFAFDSGMLRS